MPGNSPIRHCQHFPTTATRREFLCRAGGGFGTIALSSLLANDVRGKSASAADAQPAAKNPLAPRPTHFEPRAKRVIWLFMHGGPSHVDLLDPKPQLTKHSGSDYQGEVVYSFANRASKKLFGSPWKFAKRGQCGTEVSELLPNLAEIVDDIAVIRSMHTDINGHESSIWYLNTGKSQDRKSTRLNSSHIQKSRMPSSA